MVIYIIDSLFCTDAENSQSYSVLFGVIDGEQHYTLSDIKTQSPLAAKVSNLPIFADIKYTMDILNECPVMFTEILVNDCDAEILQQYPDLEIRRIQRVNGSLIEGLKPILADPSLAGLAIDFINNYNNIASQVCPVLRDNLLYLKKMPNEDLYSIIGYKQRGVLKTMGDFWEDKSVTKFIVANDLETVAHLHSVTNGFIINLAVSSATIKLHPELFHILIPEDSVYSTLENGAACFETLNVINRDAVVDMGSLPSFSNIAATSDKEAVKAYNSCFADKIFTIVSGGVSYVAGLQFKGKCISIKDIVHLNSAYMVLKSLMCDGCKDMQIAILGSANGKPTCKLLYKPSPSSLNKIEQGLVEVVDVGSMPANSIRAQLLSDFVEVGEQGINVADITAMEAIGSCLPENQTASSNAAEVIYALCNSFDSTFDTVEQFTLCNKINESVGYNSDATAYKAAIASLIDINRTQVQNTCTDTFNRELPTFERLVAIFGDDAQKDLIKQQAPTMASEEHTNVFDTEDFEYDSYTEDSDSDEGIDSDDIDEDVVENYGDLNMCINLDYIPMNASPVNSSGPVGVGPYFDSTSYKNIYNKFGAEVIASPECIEGNNANNKLAIQSNEILFYAGMHHLILEGICFENNIYTITELKNALNAGMHSVIVDRFLRYLAEDIFSLNWRHTGTVKATVSSLTHPRDLSLYKSDRQEKISSESFVCLGWYKVVKDNGKLCVVHDDGGKVDECFHLINSFIANDIVNSMAWAEAVIRLARWNTRKPRQLWIPCKKFNQNTEIYLNLLNFTKQDWCGIFDESKRVLFDGAAFTLDGRISCKLDNAKSLMGIVNYYNTSLNSKAELLYGIPLCARYEDTDETRTFYIDIFTLANSIADNKIGVAGITFNSTTQQFESSIVSSGDLIMDPDEYFNQDEFVVPLASARKAVSSNPAANEAMISIHLTRLWTLSGLAAKFSVKFPSTRILDVLSNFERASFDSSLMNKCAGILAAPANVRNASVDALCTAYDKALSMEDLANYIMFERLALPYIQLAHEIAEHKASHNDFISIAEVLTIARNIDANQSNSTSSAASVSAIPQSAIFKAHYNKCEHIYSFSLDDSVVLYIGAENVTIDGKQQCNYVVWEPTDLPDLIALGCADRTASASPIPFNTLTQSVIAPFWKHCQIAFAKNRPDITDTNRRNAVMMIKNLKQSRYISFRSGITGSSSAVTDTFSKFVFDTWFPEFKRFSAQKRT